MKIKSKQNYILTGIAISILSGILMLLTCVLITHCENKLNNNLDYEMENTRP